MFGKIRESGELVQITGKVGNSKKILFYQVLKGNKYIFVSSNKIEA